MKAVYASTVNHDDPLAALAVGEQPEPQARPFWSTVSVRAVTVNHHDVWSLQGVGLAAEQTPMILGTDAVGILDEDIPGKHGLKAGSEVVLYTFVGTDGAGVAPGERRTILSEKYPGTMAEKTSVPSANVFAKPANLTTAEAAALGTSWLTAYSLLFEAAGIKPGDSVLIQGAGGGVSTAAIQLAHAAGEHWAPARTCRTGSSPSTTSTVHGSPPNSNNARDVSAGRATCSTKRRTTGTSPSARSTATCSRRSSARPGSSARS